MASQKEEQAGAREDGARDFLARQLDMLRQGFSFSGFERDLVALNLNGERFLDVSGVSGADSVTDGRAAVYGDFDNDGDADIFLRAMHGPAHLLYRNEVGQDRSWLRVTLQGTGSGRDAFGAIVKVRTLTHVLTKAKIAGSGFLSQSDPRLLFGLDEATWVDSIDVRWPSGRRESFEGGPSRMSVLLVEGSGKTVRLAERTLDLPDPVSPGLRVLAVARGEKLPAVPLKTLQGETHSPARAARGERTLFNFWATWCAPCRAEMPELQALHRPGRGLSIVGVSVDRPRDREKIAPFLEKIGVTYPVYTLDSDALPELFRTDDVPIPLSVLVDEKGRVVDVFTGWSRDVKRRLEALVEDRSSR